MENLGKCELVQFGRTNKARIYLMNGRTEEQKNVEKIIVNTHRIPAFIS